jgi:heterogeneous nuclear rnp K-like protein 2
MSSPGQSRRNDSVSAAAAAFASPRIGVRNGSPAPSSPHSVNGALGASGVGLRTQNISIPSDMVGCIIGRQGTKITEIRRLSGSKISIAKTPHDETGERMFTIVGTPEANEKALFLLYNQLENEKERRVSREAVTGADGTPAAAPVAT